MSDLCLKNKTHCLKRALQVEIHCISNFLGTNHLEIIGVENDLFQVNSME